MGAIVTANRAAPPAVQGGSTGQYLTFMLGGEIYALGILNIKEIIEYGNLTEVPMMPPFIRGVINLRGRVVPVVDLAARIGRGATQVARRTSIVIIEVSNTFASEEGEVTETQDIGVMVDAVNEVVDIDSGDIEPAPSFGARIRPEFINGMAKRGGGFTIVLDVSRVLSVAEMSSLGRTSIDSTSLLEGDA
ncbi:MAG: chemotaxis protein CheW [Pseudomonadota bacterium]|nr:chemotaxis protein CheW [Pseudomonadota bacterium]